MIYVKMVEGSFTSKKVAVDFCMADTEEEAREKFERACKRYPFEYKDWKEHKSVTLSS